MRAITDYSVFRGQLISNSPNRSYNHRMATVLKIRENSGNLRKKKMKVREKSLNLNKLSERKSFNIP